MVDSSISELTAEQRLNQRAAILARRIGSCRLKCVRRPNGRGSDGLP